jgi:hypothetical protein
MEDHDRTTRIAGKKCALERQAFLSICLVYNGGSALGSNSSAVKDSFVLYGNGETAGCGRFDLTVSCHLSKQDSASQRHRYLRTLQLPTNGYCT